MGELALASLVVLGAWWLGTAVVLRLVWLRRATHGVSLAASSVLAASATCARDAKGRCIEFACDEALRRRSFARDS